MSIKTRTFKCPECGASIDVDFDRKQCFCSYCGSKILLVNENEFINREINEAEIEKAKSKKEIALAKIEAERKKDRAFPIMMVSIYAIIGVLILVMYLTGGFD